MENTSIIIATDQAATLAQYAPAVNEFLGKSKADNTIRAYRSDWADFSSCETETHVRALGLQRFPPIGHSLGAEVALSVCRQLGDAIGALVLEDYSPEISDGVRGKVREAFAESGRSYRTPQLYAEYLRVTRLQVLRNSLRRFAVGALIQHADGGCGWRLKAGPSLSRPAGRVTSERQLNLLCLLLGPRCAIGYGTEQAIPW